MADSDGRIKIERYPGMQVFNSVLAIRQMPQALAGWISGSGYAPMTVLLVILLTCLVFGCVMDCLSLTLLTIPNIEGLDFGMTAEATAIWFGILALIVGVDGMIICRLG